MQYGKLPNSLNALLKGTEMHTLQALLSTPILTSEERPMNTYFIELTDTFSGEANYSWVKRFLVKAETMRGAMRKVSRETGYPARKAFGDSDSARFNVPSACVCFNVEWVDNADELREQYSLIEL